MTEQVLKTNNQMTKYIFIFLLVLLVNQQLTAQVKFQFNNLKGEKLELSIIKSDTAFRHIRVDNDLGRNADSLFTYLDFLVNNDTLFYRSILDKTHKKEVFLTTQLLEKTLVSYTKKNFLTEIDSEIVTYFDAPSQKNVIACSKMKIFVGEYKFNLCDKSYPIHYFKFESQYLDDYVIGFIPNIGIVAFGYSFFSRKGEPITDIYYLRCSSFEKMRKIWQK